MSQTKTQIGVLGLPEKGQIAEIPLRQGHAAQETRLWTFPRTGWALVAQERLVVQISSIRTDSVQREMNGKVSASAHAQCRRLVVMLKEIPCFRGSLTAPRERSEARDPCIIAPSIRLPKLTRDP